MNTITIDSTLYKEAERYAAQKNMTLASFLEYAVRKIMTTTSSDAESKTYRDMLEYRKAVEYMDSLAADDFVQPVPAEERGIAALVEEKYLP